MDFVASVDSVMEGQLKAAEVTVGTNGAVGFHAVSAKGRCSYHPSNRGVDIYTCCVDARAVL